ncbi:MAG TPA: hypothetical protein VMW48_17490 [Vicinamibacterales bacterium]|nr:hypothetical protein [Vicinamibacterales bacterium]
MPSTLDAGLCGQCAWSRQVVGAASTFVMCTRGLTDSRYRKYPALPVIACRGFEIAAPPASEGGVSG